MISVKNVVVKYDNKTVINNLSWDIELYKAHGLLGLNGAGKTTLLNAMVRQIKVNSGGFQKNNSELKRNDIAYLPVANFFYSYITGKEYLKLVNAENKAFDINKWNKLFDLPLDEDVKTYSTGMKKKLAFMGMLKSNRDIIVLDEPFNGLDIEAVELIKEIIIRLTRDQKTIIITSHIIEPLYKICQKIHLLQDGVISKSYDQVNYITIEHDFLEHLKKNQATELDNLF